MRASNISAQEYSHGDSCPDLHHAALAAADPRPNLTWLDIGCGTGALLDIVLRSYQPARVTGVDVIDWLNDELRSQVDLIVGPAEQVLAERGQLADRILLVETMEHLEAPWSLLRAAARSVAPGGKIVVTTPNIASLRHRLELLTRGRLTAFRPDNLPHLGPILPHVVDRVLSEEDLQPHAPFHAGRDIVPLTGGRVWPRMLHSYMSRASSVSVVIVADKGLVNGTRQHARPH